MNWWAEWKKPIIIFLLLSCVVHLGAIAVVRYREGQCANKCHTSGAKSFEYEGFSGASGRYFHPDNCRCLN